MFEVKIDIKGIPEVQKKLEDLNGKILREAYWEMYRATRDIIEKKAKELCPIGHTGNLQKSIVTIAETGIPTKYKTATVIVRAGNEIANYAEAVEYGWTMTPEQFRAMARKKGGITPKSPSGLTSSKKFIQGRFFMSNASKYGIPLVLERMERKIEELTR